MLGLIKPQTPREGEGVGIFQNKLNEWKLIKKKKGVGGGRGKEGEKKRKKKAQ